MEDNHKQFVKPIILAFVGMPGAGKSEATAYLENKGIPFVRFGEVTDEGVKERALPLTPENERMVREKMRAEFGMAAYAIKSKPKIDNLLKTHKVIAIDGLYSWEEYLFLKKQYPNLTLINVYAESKKRYERVALRSIRPMTFEQSRQRDIAELERLNKGAPIAISDYMIENNSTLDHMHKQIDSLLARLHITIDDTY